MRCVGRNDNCQRNAARGSDLCNPCFEAVHDLEPADDMTEYGPCPECGAEADQQCSVNDTYGGDGFTTELMMWVHRRRL